MLFFYFREVAAYYEGVKTEGADVDSLNGGNLLYEVHGDRCEYFMYYK